MAEEEKKDNVNNNEDAKKANASKEGKDPQISNVEFSDLNVQEDTTQQKIDVNSPIFKENIQLLLDVPLEISVELGRSKRNVEEILSLSEGSVIELDRLAGEAIDLLVNGKVIAKGEVVVIDENFGIRITSIVSQEQRILDINLL